MSSGTSVPDEGAEAEPVSLPPALGREIQPSLDVSAFEPPRPEENAVAPTSEPQLSQEMSSGSLKPTSDQPSDELEWHDELRVEEYPGLATPDNEWVSVSTGSDFVCGLSRRGSDSTDAYTDVIGRRVECWGGVAFAQWHDGEDEVVTISAGKYHLCGLRKNGNLSCWGNDFYNRLQVPNGVFTSVAAGASHSCAIRLSGELECWGYRRGGRLNAPGGEFESVSVAKHGNHSCGVMVTGTVGCWGDNSFGQSDAPIGSFRSVSTGGDYACGLRRDGTAECWGKGYRKMDDISRVPSGSFVQVAASAFDACGLRANGNVECWGYDSPTFRLVRRTSDISGSDVSQQLVLGDDQRIMLLKGTAYIAISNGRFYMCGLRRDHVIECWAHHAGVGPDGSSLLLSPKDYIRGNEASGKWAHVSTGWRHSCGLRLDQRVECWGDAPFEGPALLKGKYDAVSVGKAIMCGLRNDNSVHCEGEMRSCELGSESRIECSDRLGPIGAPGGEFVGVSAGGYHACGLRWNGRAECWGANGNGQADAPDGRFIALSAGEFHTCGLRIDATIGCWGNSVFGMLQVPIGRFSQLSVGARHGCGLRHDGIADCWGDIWDEPGGNWYWDWGSSKAGAQEFTAISSGNGMTCGLLRDGTISCSNIAFNRVDGEFTVVAVGTTEVCGLFVDGILECWGSNYSGQIEDMP